MSSPVSLRGAGEPKRRAPRRASRRSRGRGCGATRPCAFFGRGGANASITSPARGPDTRTTATPARPGALDSAKIVGASSMRFGLLVRMRGVHSADVRQHPIRDNGMSENRLGRETSPYLLQHKDNPVHWWAWGPEALAEAKRTDKPILLSVGYAACHWCHVMAHESFEDAATAARHERAVRQHQGRPRGAARHRRHLHARAACAGRAGRLAADHVPRQRRAARSGAAPTSRRTPRYGRPGFSTCCAQVAQRLPRGAGQGRQQRRAC